MFVSETYSIEDCWYYNSTSYGVGVFTLNVPLPTGPFIFEYDVTPTSRNASAPYIDIGSGTNDRILVGQWARAGTNGIILYTGTQTNHALPNLSTLNEVNHYTFTYDGLNYKIDRDGENLTVTSVGITLSKIIHVEGGNGGILQYIKVKPL